MTNDDSAIEIDFLPVGEGEKSGDAIVFRYGRLSSVTNFSQKVVVIDGGTLDSGQRLVEHIKSFYRTDTVDLVINTHPHNDHTSGLIEILNNLKVKELWLHTPWNYAVDFIDLFKDGRITHNSLKDRLKKELSSAHELEQIAIAKKIPIKEPFSDVSYDNGIIRILGPSETYYKSMLPHFSDMPEPITESPLSKTFTVVKEAIKWVKEAMDIETLDERGETSAENNSSVITLFTFQDRKYLFTADTGIPALKEALAYAANKNIPLDDLKVFQVPHHGSKRNLSPSILNAIKSDAAYISCAKEGEPKHPAKKVTNALKRRGMKPYSTKGNILAHHFNTPTREGYSTATEIPFYEQVEE